MPGQFIVLEGIDGSGTTSVAARIAEGLGARGVDVHATREPSSGEIGQLTRSLLAKDRKRDPHALALLFAADRLDHLAADIEPAVERGQAVVCDRYLMSSWAYQSLDCDLAWVRRINDKARWPDLTVLLDLPAEIAWERVLKRAQDHDLPEERFDALDLQRRLEVIYRRLAGEESSRNVHVVDATMPLDDVVSAVSRLVAAQLAGSHQSTMG